MTTYEVRTGDCRDVMRSLPSDSVDSIVTDPPYGLSFMGKAWDHGVPGVEFWTEALRIAKPGAHLVAFGGTRTFHRLAVAIEDAGWEIRDCLSWLYGSGFPKSHNLKGDWAGWGTALKPAWEPIILARKPLTGTVAANVTQYGTGGVNVDGCRIPLVGDEPMYAIQAPSKSTFSAGAKDWTTPTYKESGRWPANVVLDEDAAGMLDAQSGERKSGSGNKNVRNRDDRYAYGSGLGAGYGDGIGGDTGGASRFFYCAKASRREREAGGVANVHPTVKPIDLMRWLCRLVTPPGGLVLDPFNGSGSTGCAAVVEGFRYLGAELDPEYAEIARKRIAHWADQQREPDLFG